jgi:hypothetical protein
MRDYETVCVYVCIALYVSSNDFFLKQINHHLTPLCFQSRRFLRFFSSGGNQGPVVWLRGEPVTMVGRGRFLAVLYHSSVPRADGTQQLEYTLWDAPAFRVLSRGSVSCMSKGSSVAWIGFSNDLSLLVMDSDGMLSMLTSTGEQQGNSSPDLRMYEWVPVLDTIGLRKSVDDRHWPVTVYDGKLVCVPLKGGNTYPDATRRPVTTTLGLRMPLAVSVVTRKYVISAVTAQQMNRHRPNPPPPPFLVILTPFSLLYVTPLQHLARRWRNYLFDPIWRLPKRNSWLIWTRVVTKLILKRSI